MYEYSLPPEIRAAMAALPSSALVPLFEVLAVLQVAPWGGEPHHKDNPDGAVRRLLFGPAGAGLLVYVILENTRQVEVVTLLWADD